MMALLIYQPKQIWSFSNFERSNRECSINLFIDKIKKIGFTNKFRDSLVAEQEAMNLIEQAKRTVETLIENEATYA